MGALIPHFLTPAGQRVFLGALTLPNIWTALAHSMRRPEAPSKLQGIEVEVEGLGVGSRVDADNESELAQSCPLQLGLRSKVSEKM